MTSDYGLTVTCGVPNKPMVPTATTWLDDDSSGPLRRHIGRPFDAERRA
jgi:hypothetical protein